MKESKYTKEILEPLVKESVSLREVVLKLNLKYTGGTHGHIKRRLSVLNLDTSHFLGKAANCGEKHKGGINRVCPEHTLVLKDKNSPRTNAIYLRKALLMTGRPYRCIDCGLGPFYNDKPLTLQIDHENGVYWDNREENLKFRCPNCHSQTETFGSYNRNNSRC